jgi:hypothetical protein
MTGRAVGEGGCDADAVTLYCVGELDDLARRRVDDHLVTCADCWGEVRLRRELSSAVRRTREVASLGLRADVRSAVTDAASVSAPASWKRRSVILGVAAAIVAVLSSVVGAAVATRTATSLSVVSAAIEQFTAEDGAAGSLAPTAPDLMRIGLHTRTAVRTTLEGTPVERFAYDGAGGTQVVMYVAGEEWRRPEGAIALGATGWMYVDGVYTVIGGPDPSGEQMLILATDHTVAMSTAVTMHLV